MTAATTDVVDDGLYADAFVPPARLRFQSGVIVTHDLTAALADIVVPTLVGVSASDPHRRRQEARARSDKADPRLVVLARDIRIGALPALPWVRVEPIAGRPLHAKFALLNFEDAKGKVRHVRAVVTSANLTDGGLRGNREVMLQEDSDMSSRDGALAWQLADLVNRLGHRRSFDGNESMPLDTARLLREVAASAKTFLKPPKVLEPMLHETVTRTGATKRLLRTAASNAARVVIVTPPFAGRGDHAALALNDVLSRGTKVDIYTGLEALPGVVPTSPPTFSTDTIERLRSVVGPSNVRVHLVPELVPSVDGPPVRRPLHAKFYAFIARDGTTQVFVGSANFTGPGLLRGNREVLAECLMDAHQVLEFVERLDASQYRGGFVDPEDRVHQRPLKRHPDLQPVFKIEPGQAPGARQWRGVLSLELPRSGRPIEVVINGVSMPVASELVVTMLEADCTVEFVWADKSRTRHLVQLEVPEGFWERLSPPDPRADINQEFLDALFDLRTAARRTLGPGAAPPGGEQGEAGVKIEAFRIPLAQRLVLLARHRHKLLDRDRDVDDYRELLSAWLKSDTEVDVGMAIVRSELGLPVDGPDPLLVALHQSLPSFDQEAG